MPDFYVSLRLQLTVCLNHGGGIDAELRRELADGWEQRGTPQCTRRNGQPHALRDLGIQRNGTARVDVVEQDDAQGSLCCYSKTLGGTTQPVAPV